MTQVTVTCEQAENPRAEQPCSGPLWICKGYFVDGSHSYRCEKHAKHGMKLNPAGPRYVPIKRGK